MLPMFPNETLHYWCPKCRNSGFAGISDGPGYCDCLIGRKRAQRERGVVRRFFIDRIADPASNDPAEVRIRESRIRDGRWTR